MQSSVERGTNVAWKHDINGATPYALQSLIYLAQHFEPDNVWLVSKGGPDMCANANKWLRDTLRITDPPFNIRGDHILYGRHRTGPNGKKGPMALPHHISHFIDDHDDCLWKVYEEGNMRNTMRPHIGTLYHMSNGAGGRRAPLPHRWGRRPDGVIDPTPGGLDLMRHLWG